MYMPVYAYTAYTRRTIYIYTRRFGYQFIWDIMYVCVSRTRARVFVTVLISVLLAAVVRPPPRTTVTSCKMMGVALIRRQTCIRPGNPVRLFFGQVNARARERRVGRSRVYTPDTWYTQFTPYRNYPLSKTLCVLPPRLACQKKKIEQKHPPADGRMKGEVEKRARTCVIPPNPHTCDPLVSISSRRRWLSEAARRPTSRCCVIFSFPSLRTYIQYRYVVYIYIYVVTVWPVALLSLVRVTRG